MCKVIDDILPVVGGIVGTIIAPGVGTAIGAGLGGFAGNYVQNHDFGSALLAGGTNAAMGAITQGALGGIGAPNGAGDIGAGAFNSGLEGAAGNAATNSLGGLEGDLGGSALFGMNAGTGTAIGQEAASNMGAGGLGIAGGASSLGDVLGGNTSFAGQLGGGDQGTGMSAATGNGGALLPAQQPMSGGALGGEGSQTTNPSTMSQISQTGVAPQQTFSAEGLQTAPQNMPPPGAGMSSGVDTSQGLSTMYGPDSTAPQSPMGASLGQAANAQMPGGGSSQVGFTSIPGTGGSMGGDDFSWNSPQGLSTMFRLGNAGLGAYQQYQQGQAAHNYANSINQMFAPDSPYAQQMQQELARKDAAAGRNSQYGSRAVQLAAALTQARAQALGGNNYANAARNTSGASMLNGLFSNFASPQAMQGLYGAGQSAFNGLSSLF